MAYWSVIHRPLKYLPPIRTFGGPRTQSTVRVTGRSWETLLVFTTSKRGRRRKSSIRHKPFESRGIPFTPQLLSTVPYPTTFPSGHRTRTFIPSVMRVGLLSFDSRRSSSVSEAGTGGRSRLSSVDFEEEEFCKSTRS